MRPPRPNKPKGQAKRQTKAERVKAAALAKLQAEWYAKLKAEGFKDIEGGRDLNKSNGQTLRGAGPNSHVLWEITDDAFGPVGSGYDETQGIGDTAKYEYFDRIATYAAALPGETRKQAKYKAMCTLAGQGVDRLNAGKELNMNKAETATMWSQMLSELNLPSRRGPNVKHLQEPAPAPGPARILGKAEIAKLGYTAPKLIKDRTDG